jgi:hypothetical protein
MAECLPQALDWLAGRGGIIQVLILDNPLTEEGKKRDEFSS